MEQNFHILYMEDRMTAHAALTTFSTTVNFTRKNALCAIPVHTTASSLPIATLS
jgi:hypothetical protein